MENKLEDCLGHLLDILIPELYWNNSLFSSDEFNKIVEELITERGCADLIILKKRLFREIMRNLVCLSICKTYDGHLNNYLVYPIYVLYGFYDKNPASVFNYGEMIVNTKKQLTFVTSVVCSHDFPSKYDSYNELLSFARECMSMSDFVLRRKHSRLHTGIDGPCDANLEVCDTIRGPVQTDHSSEPPCSATGLPNSIDKIIDAIMKIVESENTDLSEDDQQILNNIDSELSHIL